MKTLVRKLTPFEASFGLPWHRDDGVLPMNCYIAVKLTASQELTNNFKARAQQAALSVQRRHPLLGMSIGRSVPLAPQKHGFLALFKTDSRIQVEVRPSILDKVTLETVSSECLDWKDTRPGAPTCKIIALQHGSTYVLYFAMTHAIFDGRSAQIITDEFLKLLANPEALLPTIDEATESMSFRDIMVTEKIQPADGFMDHVRPVMGARPVAGKLTGDHTKIEVQQGTGSLLIELSTSQTQACLMKAKSMGVTFNTLACAAWARAVSGDQRYSVGTHGSQFLAFIVDARAALPPKYANTLAQLMGPGFVTVDLKQSLAQQCEHIGKTINKVVGNNWHFIPTNRGENEGDDPTRWATVPIGELSTSFAKVNATLSNLGRIVFVETDAFNIERAWLAGGLYPDGNLICQAASTAGVCTFSIQYVKPAHSVSNAKHLATAFKKEMGL